MGSPVSTEEKKEIFLGLYGKEDALIIPSDDAPCIVENTAQLRLEQLSQKLPENNLSSPMTKRAIPSVCTTNHSLKRGGGADEVITHHHPSISSSSSTKGGKKRIRPVQVNNEGGHSNDEADAERARARGRFMSHSVTTNGAMEEGDDERSGAASMKQRRRVDGGVNMGGCGLYHPVIDIHIKTDGAGPLVAPKSFVPLNVLLPEDESNSNKEMNGGDPRSVPAVIARHIQSFDGSGHVLEDIDGTDDSSSRKLILECKHINVGNNTQGGGTYANVYSKVLLSSGTEILWRDFVAGKTSCCCGNLIMSAVGTTDGSVYVYDRVGIRRAPALVVGAGAAHLECSQIRENILGEGKAETVKAEDGAEQPNFLMCISTDGIVQVWNMSSLTLHVRGSLAPLISSLKGQPPKTEMNTTTTTMKDVTHPPSSATKDIMAKVIRSGLAPDGSPVVIMGCQGAFGGSLQAFVLHHGLSTWVRLADGRFALSDFHQGLGDVLAGDDFLSQLQASVSRGVKVPASLLHVRGGSSGIVEGQMEALQWCVTRAHLEDSLACCSLILSNDELKYWLSRYTHHLANCSVPDIPRIRALVDYMQLDSMVDEENNNSDDHPRRIGTSGRVGRCWLSRGQDGRKLVREVVLPAISSNRQLQKFVNEIDSEDKLFLSQQQEQQQN